MKVSLATALLVGLSQPALANIDIVFDYSRDTGNYFSTTAIRNVLDQAASAFESRIQDDLGPISASGFNVSIFNPAAPEATGLSFANQTFKTNEIRVYVAGYASALDAAIGLGGPGGYSCSGIACTQASRGQTNASGSGATDFAPWGGAIAFNFDDIDAWNTSMAAPLGWQTDLYSVAIHELGHVLGFGTAPSFNTYVTGNQFSLGSASQTLSGDLAHWADDTMSTANGIAQEAAMTSYLTIGQRKDFTELDFAALDRIGWEVSPVPEADTWAMLLAGLGLVGLASRRRMSINPDTR